MGRDGRRNAGTGLGVSLRAAVGIVLVCAVGGVPLFLATGCGTSTSTKTEPLPSTPTAQTVPPVSTSTTPSAGSPSTGWEPPSADVLAAFTERSAEMACPLYVPALLPSGTLLGPRGVDLPLGNDVGAELVVDLVVDGGVVQVGEGIAADIGDVPGEPCGEVAGRPATAYRMLGGVLVQWSAEGWWYGVFSRDVPRETVIGVALSMTDTEIVSR
ncbi:MAG: hypothetical protein ACYC6T_06515 [Thermoleophilia bacterium]